MELNKFMQRDNKDWQEKYQRSLKEAIQHVEFCCVLYRHQLKSGRHFVHEHPWGAKSWKLECIKELVEDDRTSVAYTHMCRFGMTTHVDKKDGERGHVLKPTGFLTSSWAVYQELNKQCQGGHAHVPLEGGRAKHCQVYPPDLCTALNRGIMKQKSADKGGEKHTGKSSVAEMHSLLCRVMEEPVEYTLRKNGTYCQVMKPVGEWKKGWIDHMHEPEGGCDLFGDKKREGVEEMSKQMNSLYERQGMPEAWDDVNGVFLDANKVRDAREEEMAFFRKLGVYKRVHKSQVQATGGKMITVKWLDTNKGDKDNPNYRSRLVGREYNEGKDDSLYASTPPLEALRLIVSHAASVEENHKGERREIMINDVRRAYFYAKQQRNLFINLPKEDIEAGPDDIGQLLLCLYGTRDAAKEWQKTLTRHLLSIGFSPGKGHPSVFVHKERDIRVLVHGDDYFSSGLSNDLSWLQSKLEEIFEIKTQHINGKSDHEMEGKILNRVVRWTQKGYEVEADPRHAELVIKQLEASSMKTLSTPGVEGKEEEDNEEDYQLTGESATQYRAIAARLNYLSTDRPDIQYATKECCRDMATPTTGSQRRLLRIARYLVGRPRLVWRFDMQGSVDVVEAFSDANWAGCRTSRKSTSGGVLMVGAHPIKSYSKTQAVIAKSSAESELYGIVRATCEALGCLTLIEDFGGRMKSRLHMDANAARGIIDRQGLSKVRHIDVNLLWLQEQEARDLVPLEKIDGTKNCADLMTKHVRAELIARHTDYMNLEFRGGRSDIAAQLQSTNKSLRKREAQDKLIAACEKYDPSSRKDAWSSRGDGGDWVRIHATPRRSLFTPGRVPRGPSDIDRLHAERITKGINASGRMFKIIDDWRCPQVAHKVLDEPWTGCTIFRLRT